MIDRNSTSYPTLAVILHHGVTNGEQKTAIWMLSWRMFQFFYHQGNAGTHPSNDERQGPEGCWFWYERLRDLIVDQNVQDPYERLDLIVGHLIANQEGSVAAIKAGAV